MLTIGIDVVLLAAAGIVIAFLIYAAARRNGMDKTSANALSYSSMATTALLIAFYIVMSYVLDALSC